MGFCAKWVGWAKWCIFTTSFSVLVNGTPAGFFNNSKGLRQGDPLSPYLFVTGMEALSCLIKRAVSGGYLTGCRVKGKVVREFNSPICCMLMTHRFSVKPLRTN